MTVSPTPPGITYHCYADDFQIFSPTSPTNTDAFGSLIDCIDNIKFWLEKTSLIWMKIRLNIFYLVSLQPLCKYA